MSSLAQCQVFRARPDVLVAALADAAMIERWQAQVAAELPSIAEGPLIRHLRRLSGLADIVRSAGLAAALHHDRAGTDALLGDVLAVATWHQWPLPLHHHADQQLDLSGLPRGLLAADDTREGASVVVLDTDHIALARDRAVATSADMSQHPRSG